ncbi:MAG: hypothetical protein Q9224_004602 [Gallowayella concinna]
MMAISEHSSGGALRKDKGYHHSFTDKRYLQNACASVFGSPLTNVYSTSRKGEGPIPQDPNLITIDPKSIQSNTVFADIIGIHWAETDSQVIRLMSETTSSSPTTATITAAQTAHQTIPVVSPTTPASPTSTPLSGGLYTGAEAGIGIGAVVGAIGLALLAYFLWRRRQRGRNVEDTTVAGDTTVAEQSGYQDVHELGPEQEKRHVRQPAELPSQIAYELLPSQIVHQVPADEGRSELDSNSTTNRNTEWSSTTGTVSSKTPSQSQIANYV